jgi:hypothetical protein
MQTTAKNYDIIHVDARYCTLYFRPVGLLLLETRAIITDLDVILHVFMLQIIYTTVLRVNQSSNLSFHVRLFNSLSQKTVVYILHTIQYTYIVGKYKIYLYEL